MTRLKTFGTPYLAAVGLLLAVSAGQAETLYHPYCGGNPQGPQATSCTQIDVSYKYTHVQLNGRVEDTVGVENLQAVIKENCEVATNQGQKTLLAATETPLTTPEPPGAPTYNWTTPKEVYYYLPSGCAVGLTGVYDESKKFSFTIDAARNSGRRLLVFLDVHNSRTIKFASMP